MPTPQDILEFWYAPAIAKHWFAATPALDQEIRTRFAALWQQAAAGELDAWAATPEGALALIIVLDQFPLNMYRGQPASFSSEAKAIEVAKRAVAQGFHTGLPEDRKLFMFMPLMHSERLDDQDRSVELYRANGMDPRWAEHHRTIVRRFGRFPHRNAILGRPDTPEERDYLASDEAFKG